jgi:phage tail sheath protein FI
LLITVQRWLEKFMTGITHEPNDIRLWVRIMREVTAYLDGLFRLGALKGRIPEEAFYVKCDGETNPPEVRQSGRVVTEIGLAPVQPAEFILVRVVHGDSGVTVSNS